MSVNHQERYVVLDVETTGLSPWKGDRVIESMIINWQGDRFISAKPEKHLTITVTDYK